MEFRCDSLEVLAGTAFRGQRKEALAGLLGTAAEVAVPSSAEWTQITERSGDRRSPNPSCRSCRRSRATPSP